MLRIERSDVAPRQAVLAVQGHIVAEWAGLLERECMALIQSGVLIQLDLSEVAFIGSSGVESLSRICRAGAVIIDCPPLIADVLEQAGLPVARGPGGAGNGHTRGNQR